MATTIFQAPNGDFALDENMCLILETDQVIVAGIMLRNRFKFFEGTWFLDLTEGFPYYRSVFVKNPDMNHIRRLFTRLILSVSPVIDTVERLDLKLGSDRRLKVYFLARAVDGRVLEGGPGLPFRINGEEI